MNATRIVHNIPRRRAMDFLWSETAGRIFTAYFYKADGSLRGMNCRRGVKRYLAGGELRYDPKPKMLLPVFDLKAGQYRTVNVGTLVSFNIGGETFLVQ